MGNIQKKLICDWIWKEGFYVADNAIRYLEERAKPGFKILQVCFLLCYCNAVDYFTCDDAYLPDGVSAEEYFAHFDGRIDTPQLRTALIDIADRLRRSKQLADRQLEWAETFFQATERDFANGDAAAEETAEIVLLLKK